MVVERNNKQIGEQDNFRGHKCHEEAVTGRNSRVIEGFRLIVQGKL